jgi:hypothetical protein
MSWPFSLPDAAVTPQRDATRSGLQQKRPRSPSPEPEREPDDSECFICADAPACVVLSACGHGGMCEVCCEKWRKAERKAKRSPACALCKTYVLPGSCVTATDASSAYVAGRVDPAAAAAAAAYTLLVKKIGETVCFDTGSGLNVRDRHGWTLLHYGCDSGLSDCVRMLLLAGADAGAADTAGVTPLHAALDIAADASVAIESRIDCAMLLLQSGAERLAVDALGCTARDYALKCDAAGAALVEQLDVRLAVHESLLDPVLLSFVCDCCSTAFAQLSELSEHKQTHDKPYACDEPGCGFRSTRPGRLKDHKRVHSGEKPHACDEPGCGFSCAQRGHLIRHKQTHTGEDVHLRRAWLQLQHCATGQTERPQADAHRRGAVRLRGARLQLCVCATARP